MLRFKNYINEVFDGEKPDNYTVDNSLKFGKNVRFTINGAVYHIRFTQYGLRSTPQQNKFKVDFWHGYADQRTNVLKEFSALKYIIGKFLKDNNVDILSFDRIKYKKFYVILKVADYFYKKYPFKIISDHRYIGLYRIK